MSDRQERLRRLTEENRRQRVREDRTREVCETVRAQPAPEDFLDLDAARDLHSAFAYRARYHRSTHRTWGDRFPGEVARTVHELSGRVGPAEAFLLFTEPVDAVRVPVWAVLRHAAETLSRETDVMLITRDEQSGLVLTWDHFPSSDEYSLVTWGDFAFDLGAGPTIAQERLALGRVAFELLPVAERPRWAAQLLRACLAVVDDAPPEVVHVLELAEDEARWAQARDAFDRVRRLARDPAGNRPLLRLAEVVAKVTYNASGGSAPFDHHAGWRLLQHASHVLTAAER